MSSLLPEQIIERSAAPPEAPAASQASLRALPTPCGPPSRQADPRPRPRADDGRRDRRDRGDARHLRGRAGRGPAGDRRARQLLVRPAADLRRDLDRRVRRLPALREPDARDRAGEHRRGRPSVQRAARRLAAAARRRPGAQADHGLGGLQPGRGAVLPERGDRARPVAARRRAHLDPARRHPAAPRADRRRRIGRPARRAQDRGAPGVRPRARRLRRRRRPHRARAYGGPHRPGRRPRDRLGAARVERQLVRGDARSRPRRAPPRRPPVDRPELLRAVRLERDDRGHRGHADREPAADEPVAQRPRAQAQLRRRRVGRRARAAVAAARGHRAC